MRDAHATPEKSYEASGSRQEAVLWNNPGADHSVRQAGRPEHTLRRTAGPFETAANRLKLLDRNVNDLSLDELRRFDVGIWKGKQFEGERIATLEEAFEALPAGKQYLVEVKGGDNEILPLICRCMDEQTSVAAEQIIWIGEVSPNYFIGLIQRHHSD